MEGLIASFQQKKTMRTQFKTKNNQDEIQVEHDRLLKHFYEIDKGRWLSVGPAHMQNKMPTSPVEEMHSLNFVSKVREYTRIDQENEKLIQRLSNTSTGIVRREELK